MNEQYDGFTTLPLGMNAQKDPFLLTAQQCARAVNVTFRGGLAKTRPGFIQDLVNLPEGGEFQGAAVWRRPEGDVIVFVQLGVIYALRLVDYRLTRFGKRFTPGARCHFAQADRYFIIMDGQQYPVVLESRDIDVIKRRPQSSDELTPPEGETAPNPPIWYQSLPRCSLGLFAQGRLHVVPRLIPTTSQSGKSSILSGDIMEPLYPQTVLKFSETEYLSEGGAHAMPFQMGAIGALGAFRNAATGTGTGQVIVFADNGVCAYDFSIPRAQWKEQVLSQVLFFGCGCNSPWSVVDVNNDIVYRSHGGIRTIKYTQAQTSSGNGTLANLPMSNEVETFLKDDTLHLPWISAAAWDNRVVSVCHGSAGTFERYFQGLVVWDTAANYYNGVASTGVYDGLWTGLDVAQVLSARERGLGRETLYMLTKDMALFHVDPEATTDWCPAPAGYGAEYLQYSPIVSRIESAVLPFGDLVVSKQLKWAELWVKDVPGNTSIKMWYRPSGYPLWTRMGDTRTIAVGPGDTVHPLLRRRLRFPVEVEDCACDPSTGHPLWLGTGFQLAIEWTGNLTLERATACAVALQEAPPQPCDEEEAVIAEAACSGELLDDYSYAIDFEYVFSPGEEGGLWLLNGKDADPEIPGKPPGDDPQDPATWDPPEDAPAPEDPPLAPPFNDDGGDEGDEPRDSVPPVYVPPEAPPPPVNPEDPPGVVTRAAAEQTAATAKINGEISGMSATYSSAQVYFRYRKAAETAWQATSPTGISSTSPAKVAFSASLSGLTADTLYYFQAWALVAGLASELNGARLSFRTLRAVIPSLGFSVIIMTPDRVTSSSARLKGAVAEIPSPPAADAAVRFSYKRVGDSTFTHTAWTPVSAAGIFTQDVVGLFSDTDYVVLAQGLYNEKSVASTHTTFRTLTPDEDPPVGAVPEVETVEVYPSGSGESGLKYILFGQVADMGGADTAAPWLRYRVVGSGETGWVEMPEVLPTEVGSAGDKFNDELEIILPGSDYEFQAGMDYQTALLTEQTAFGDIIPLPQLRFALGAPVIGADKTSATLNGEVTDISGLSEGQVVFEYRPVTDPETEAWTQVESETIFAPVFMPPLECSAAITGLDLVTYPGGYECRMGIVFRDYADEADITVYTDAVALDFGFRVATVGATASMQQMTVTGAILGMGAYAEVSRFVEYRVVGGETWTRVAVPGTQSAVGTFSLTITRLSPTANTTYEYRVGCAYAGADIGFGEVMSIGVSGPVFYARFGNHLCWWDRQLAVINASLAEG